MASTTTKAVILVGIAAAAYAVYAGTSALGLSEKIDYTIKKISPKKLGLGGLEIEIEVTLINPTNNALTINAPTVFMGKPVGGKDAKGNPLFEIVSQTMPANKALNIAALGNTDLPVMLFKIPLMVLGTTLIKALFQGKIKQAKGLMSDDKLEGMTKWKAIAGIFGLDLSVWFSTYINLAGGKFYYESEKTSMI